MLHHVIEEYLQDVAYTLKCFMMEYMLPDVPTPDARGPLPNHSPEIIQEIESGLENEHGGRRVRRRERKPGKNLTSGQLILQRGTQLSPSPFQPCH